MDTTDLFRTTSFKEALCRQVEEQSPVCDFTIKVGAWAKKFHASILTRSPFFHCMIDGQYLLRDPASVEFCNTSPSSVEMAIMCLYGKCPQVKHTDIPELLDLAEFMMIPNLKYMCVKLIRCIPVNKSNVIHHLQLASMYEFDIPRATTYLHKHLGDLLEDDSLIQASKDFIENIFSNETLRYVPMDSRLQFLIRWTQYNISDRERSFPQLFALLCHNQLSEGILQEATASLGILDCIQSALLTNRLEDMEVVAIIPSFGYRTEWYDLCSDHWLKPPISLTTSAAYEHSSYMFAISKHSSWYGLCYSSKIEFIDASTNNSKTVQLSKMRDGFTSVCANASIVVAYYCKVIKIRAIIKTTHIGGHRRYRTVYKLQFDIGKLDNKSSDVIMEPVFTLNFSGDARIFINEMDVCAIFIQDKIILFDLRSFQMETLELKAMKQFYVVPVGHGFVIHDDITAICIQNVPAPTLGCRYILRNLNLPHNRDSIKYRLVGDVWFRQLDKEDDFVLERSCERFSVFQIADLSTLTWQQCKVPPDVQLSMFIHDTAVLLLTVPTQAVRCHIQCPHCEIIEEASDNFVNDTVDDAVRTCSWNSDSDESEDLQSSSNDDVNYYIDPYFDIEDTYDYSDYSDDGYYNSRNYRPNNYHADQYEYSDEPDLWN